MEKYLADSDVIIDLFRGNAKVKEFLDDNVNNVLVSYVSLGEIFQGIKNKVELVKINKVLMPLEIDWGSHEIATSSIALLKRFNLKYGVGFLDCLMAATALDKNYVLVTRNAKHFKFIPKLKIQIIK